MYPFGDLAGNLAAFCGQLRREHGFHLGPGQIVDAARVLHTIDISDQRHVRDAWRTVLSSSRDTAATFDAAFDAFFFPGPAGMPQEGLPATTGRTQRAGRGETAGEPLQIAAAPDAGTDGDELEHTEAGVAVLSDDAETQDVATSRWATARYSPLAVGGLNVLELRPASAPWRDGARALIRRLAIGLSRRWTPARRGPRFDLRRTWRASLQTGGEAVAARWQQRVRRRPQIVILIDGSRSMGAAHGPALDVAVAIASVTRRVGVFVFSTCLAPLTQDVRLAAAGRRVHVSLERDAWGGGTSIGASLRTFLRAHGERLVSADTLVIMVSDGLDVGEPTLLRDSMRDLHRRAAGVVWLNPLLETPGYEPTSRGMMAARPFITTLGSVSDAAGLARLARIVRLRR